MKELFGIPMGSLLVVLLVALGAVLGAVAVLAVRNRIFLTLALRNASRRGARTALIVLGLMLGTTIVAAALATGDTMSSTIRSTAIRALGETDVVVSARSAEQVGGTELGGATGVRYFEEEVAARIDRATAGSGLVDGVAPAIAEEVALADLARGRTEPRVLLFAADPERMEGFGTIEQVGGGAVGLGELAAGEAYLNEEAADELGARPGDRVTVFVADRSREVTVGEVVRYDGTLGDGPALLLSLDAAQRLLGREGEIEHVLVSNRGDAVSGVGLSDEVVRLLEPELAPLGLEAQTTKQDAIELADEAGSAFMSVFAMLGSFSIAAGVLLIFLVFVMLAAERRGELGIARAVGTRRGHLVQTYVFEGLAYDLLAALVGTLAGAAVAYGMVVVIAQALAQEGLDIAYSVTWRSLGIAYALGVLLTFLVVAFSAWRVSVMNISSAIRSLPEPLAAKARRRRWIGGLAVVALGALLIVAGASGQALPFYMGMSFVLVGAVPVLRALGAPERAAFTGAGLLLVAVWLAPWQIWEPLVGPLEMDMSIWIASGLMVVVGAVWTIMYNAPLLLAPATWLGGRVAALAPVLKMTLAYPLANRFRTGMTLAMFTLVVFTLVTGTATSGSFQQAFADVEEFGGGFDVRAGSSPASPIDDLEGALAEAPGVPVGDVVAVGSQAVLPVEARQEDTGAALEPYVSRGLDDGFLAHTTFGLGAMAEGYESAEDVWAAVRAQPGLAVVDSLVVPRRSNFNLGMVPPDFALTGFFLEDGTFEPIPVLVRDPQTGAEARLTVIGVLKDSAPFEMAGLSTSQETLAAAFPGRARPTVFYLDVREGGDPAAVAVSLESAFLANGLEAEPIADVVDDLLAANTTFNRLIQGFMGLGLVVGVAALGVISARSVVERRQQIGVLRSIGFRRGMVQASLLLESALVALTSIVVGTGLGILLAFEIVVDTRRQATWSNLELVVPWVNFGVIFLVVLAVALAATFAPARRAARIRPAEALRYE